MTSRLGVSTNLITGSTHDLLLVKIDGVYPEGKLSFGFYSTPMKITGVQKVAQTFLKILLTSKGSDPFYPGLGTSFSDLFQGFNKYQSDALVLASINSQVADAISQTRSILNPYETDPGSTLSTVDVMGIDLVEDKLVVYLRLTTGAGDMAAVALPFPEFGLG